MRVAAVPFHSKLGAMEDNLQRTIARLEQLAEKGVEFVLFPEMNLSGYTKDIELINRLQHNKTKLLQVLCSISEKLNMGFAVGFPERVEESIFIAHFVFFKGELVGVHRKTHLGPTEKEVFSEGSHIEVFDLEGLKVGIQLCFETHFPEIAYAQAQQGAHLLAMAFASPRESSEEKLERIQRFLPARAYDNACNVITCNISQEGNLVFPPLAMSIDAKGKVLQTSTEEYIIEDFDINEIDKIKNSRMGLFNQSKRTAVFKKYYE